MLIVYKNQNTNLLSYSCSNQFFLRFHVYFEQNQDYLDTTQEVQAFLLSDYLWPYPF